MHRRLPAFLMMLALPSTALAQRGVLLQGLLDLEGWKTDTMSTLLRRNHGNAGEVYRLRMWSAIEPLRGVFAFANVEATVGNAQPFDESDLYVEMEQWGLRLARHRALVLNAGR